MSGVRRSEVRTEVTSEELKEYIDTIEETYEFFLAYAAQGVSGSGKISGELTRYLSRADQALAAFEGDETPACFRSPPRHCPDAPQAR